MNNENNQENLKDDWFNHQEGQLSVDVIETPNEIIIRSAIAGVTVEDLDINVTNDTVTIRGQRENCQMSEEKVIHIEECYWGNFSRSIILPGHINPDTTDAVLKNGILTITLKKIENHSQVEILNLD